MSAYHGGETCGWFQVSCPSCGNINRSARRACRDCSRTGKVRKLS